MPIIFSFQGCTRKQFVFWCQMKAHICLIITQKFQHQIHYTLEFIADFQYTNIYFLIYFHISLILSVTYLFFAPGEKIKSQLEVKLCKMCLGDQGQSIQIEITHVKMDTTPFKFKQIVVLFCFVLWWHLVTSSVVVSRLIPGSKVSVKNC